MRPRLLDLFCGAGGAARGYQLAGFEVWGVDVAPQPRYCGERFQQMDAFEYVERYGTDNFDAIHASPPCQFYASLSDSSKHWRSIPPTRELLMQTGLPYVIENIRDALWDMRTPVQLCGSTLGLKVRRHRLFETSFPMLVEPCRHAEQGEIRAYYGKPGWAAWTPGAAAVQSKDRKPLLRGSVERAAVDMGIDWMTWDELREAVPPAMTEYVGHQLMQHVRARAVA